MSNVPVTVLPVIVRLVTPALISQARNAEPFSGWKMLFADRERVDEL